tara:strand:- start:7067 stop:7414 length:348 start_codon:yes stop_codon:yes gene_type:complete
MNLDLKRQVDILIINLSIIIFRFFGLELGRPRHFGRLVSLSPAMRKAYPKVLKYKKGQKALCVEETIEDSHYVQGLKALKSLIHAQLSSDTILNSTTTYPNYSTITRYNWRYYDK